MDQRLQALQRIADNMRFVFVMMTTEMFMLQRKQ